jgi:hypothetical protein
MTNKNNKVEVFLRPGLDFKWAGTIKFKLEMTVIIRAKDEKRIIEAARKIYEERGPATTGDEGDDRVIPAAEFVDDIQGALIELVECNLRMNNIECCAGSCSPGEEE